MSENAAGIEVQGSHLKLDNGSLSIIGGDIRIEEAASVVASGGEVRIVSVASRGEVVFDPAHLQPEIEADSFDQLGEAEIVQRQVTARCHETDLIGRVLGACRPYFAEHR